MAEQRPTCLTRRQALERVLLTGAGAATAALLAACGAGGAASGSTSASGSVTASSASVASSPAATSASAPTTTASTVPTTAASSASAASTTASAAPSTASATASGNAAAAGSFSGKVIKIGIDLPISGADASDGVPTENGAKLAIDQASKKGTVPGYTLQAVVLDDAVNGVHDPQQGARNTQQFIADPAVLAIVGPFNSNVAKVEIPLTNEAGLSQISPANTNEGLTKPQFGGLDLRKAHPDKIAYFRVCTTDDIQGPAGADYAYDKLGKKAAYIIDDNETYGKGVADNFEKEFTKKGGKVLGHDHVTTGQQDFKSLLTKIKGTNPDIVIFGGTSSNGGGLIRAQMKDVGLNLPYLGFDGIGNDQFIKDAGDNADNSYYTVAAVNAVALPEAQQFITDYKAAYNQDIGSYSANAYDAAGIILAAIVKAVQAGNLGRETVRANIAATKDYKGVIGTTSFDENGDTTNRIISIYAIKSGKAQFVDQVKA